MMLNGWRLPLRLAFRDMRRYKGRSVLASLLIFLPVLVMGAALTGISTWQVSDSERSSMVMAHAAGQITFPTTAKKGKKPLPGMTHAADFAHVPTPTQLANAGAGPSALLIEKSTLATQGQGAYSGTVASISGDPKVSSGLFTVISGHAPRNANEVVVSTQGQDMGFPSSGQLTFSDGSHKSQTVTIVGIAVSHTGDAVIGRMPLTSPMSVIALTATAHDDAFWAPYGIDYTSRSALLKSSNDGSSAGPKQAFLIAMGTALLVTTLALLAGPAFAASANRSRRSLALISINGAKRNFLRRVVLAQALVLGSLAAAVGVSAGGVLGVLLAKNAHLIWPARIAGPTQIPWGYCLLIWIVSTFSALIAAFAPAVSAGRTSVLAALRGQVSPRRIRKHMPAAGALLLLLGLVLTYLADNRIINRKSGGGLEIAVGIPLYFAGVMLLIPTVLLGIGHLARNLPVTARIAIRDVSRQRSRATAAVGAVLVTLSLLSTALVFELSYDKYLKNQYVPAGPLGTATLDYGQFGGDTPAARVISAAQESVPGAVITQVDQFASVDADQPPRSTNAYYNAKNCSIHDLANSVGAPRSATPDALTTTTFDSTNPGSFTHLDANQRHMLNTGGVLVVITHQHRTLRAGHKPDGLSATDIHNGRLTITTAHLSGVAKNSASLEGQFGATAATCSIHTVPATTVYSNQLGGIPHTTPGTAIMLTATARKLGAHPSTQSVIVSSKAGITEQELASFQSRFSRDNPVTYTYALILEKGYYNPVRIIAAVLTALAIVVVLMTTIIATLLNQAEGKADAATLEASGASRGMSRKVASFQAAAIGLIGGVVGSLVGFGPGALLAYANTSHSNDQYIYSPIIEIPWQYLGIVILVVPLVAGLVIALTVPRSPEITRRTV